MQRELKDMPDQAVIWVFIANRQVTPVESERLLTLVTGWLCGWGTFYTACPVSRCETMFGGQAMVFAVDDRPRFPNGSQASLSGSDLDPLFRSLEAYGNPAVPPLRIIPNLALLVGNELVPAYLESRAR